MWGSILSCLASWNCWWARAQQIGSESAESISCPECSVITNAHTRFKRGTLGDLSLFTTSWGNKNPVLKFTLHEKCKFSLHEKTVSLMWLVQHSGDGWNSGNIISWAGKLINLMCAGRIVRSQKASHPSKESVWLDAHIHRQRDREKREAHADWRTMIYISEGK